MAPQRDLGHLDYYFDLYRWSDHDQFGPIRANSRVVPFPGSLEISGMVIVISGEIGTGRTSLENLLLLEIAELSPLQPPMLTRYTVAITSNKIQAAQNFATLFIRGIGRYLTERGTAEAERITKELKEIVKDWRETLVDGETNTEFLFAQMTGIVREALPDTPIVFCVDASSHFNTPDVWRPHCIMLSNLADFVILLLSNRDHASYLRTSLKDNQIRATWIDAQRIGSAQAKDYLIDRLTAKRLGSADSLHPFTNEALQMLFAGGPGSGSIVRSINTTLQQLKHAMKKKGEEIIAIEAAHPDQEIPLEQVQITGNDMKRYGFPGR